MTTRAVVLSRRSLDNEEAATSLGRQQRSGVEFCLGQDPPWTVVEVVEERGSAWKRSLDERPDLARALSLLRKGDADVLVVERVDRLTRRGSGELLTLIEELDALKRRVYFLDLGGFGDEERTRMVLSLLGELARSEAVAISTRQKASQEDRRKRGLRTAGKPPTFFVKDGDKLRLSDRAAARAIVDRALAGEPWFRIAQDLGWSDSRLRDWIRRPALAGWAAEPYGFTPMMVEGEYVTIVTDKPLITPAERETIMNRFGSGTRGRPTDALILKGLARSTDGRALVPSGNNIYRVRRENDVAGFLVPQDDLDAFVGEKVAFHVAMMDDAHDGPERDFLLGLAELFSGPDPDAVERVRLTDEVAELRGRIQQLEDDFYVAGSLPRESFDRISGTLREQFERVQQKLDAVPASQISTGFLRAAPVSWNKWTMEARRALVAYCVEAIEVEPPGRPVKDKVRIIWRSISEASGAS